jgi:hypothetical protein
MRDLPGAAVAPSAYDLIRLDLCQCAPHPPLQRAGEARGRNFQKIRVRNQVVNLQDSAELPAYFSAILDRNPSLSVDVKSQDPALRFSLVFQVNQFQSLGLKNRLYNLPNFTEKLIKFQIISKMERNLVEE